ncbi:MAG TPA: holo-ACP synthase [Methylomusa anaerophila]|uniref:Holo-[acyl-carrier-protein] synthase n=1 Tax=Methylomusa anaerophila TaxID=1930071 RepID=A0A348AMJ2_9FIRM|nr:holo-ACP synthase [Methylomusa anaerophila]BBB92290.1 holo-[acyl-carrier-protein] synthase [Methylomusa anaerophila]HML90249.1 holo-ACP synthase [Methylomusa anaerophila]
MIFGTGIDIVETNRIKKAIQHRQFVARVFTPREQEYCESRHVQRVQSYAARFAGKEAVAKAFGTGFSGGTFQDIEILPDVKGCPKVRLCGSFAAMAVETGVTQIYLSLTHTREYAAAQVILWRGDNNESGNSGANA